MDSGHGEDNRCAVNALSVTALVSSPRRVSILRCSPLDQPDCRARELGAKSSDDEDLDPARN